MRTVTREGTTTLYLGKGPGDFSNPDSFRSGTPIQTSSIRQQVVVDTVTSGFTTSNFNVVNSASSFTLNGVSYQFGAPGQTFRTSLTGHLTAAAPPSGYFGGYATGTDDSVPFLSATPDEMRRTVTLKTTLGPVRIAMEPGWAPNHVRNFLKLVSTGWYDGTAFHRLVKGFVLQGGMPNTRLGNPTHPADRWVHTLKGEFRPGIKHVRGIVSMARGDDPDSADTSFFLMLGDAPYLDGKYSAFGRVVSGMEVLDAFEKEDVDGETPKRRLELIQATIDK